MFKITYINYNESNLKRLAFFEFFEKIQEKFKNKINTEDAKKDLQNLCETHNVTDLQQKMLLNYLTRLTTFNAICKAVQINEYPRSLDLKRFQEFDSSDLFEQFVQNPFIFNMLTFDSIVKCIDYNTETILAISLYFLNVVYYAKIAQINLHLVSENFLSTCYSTNKKKYRWSTSPSQELLRNWPETSAQHARIISSMLKEYRSTIFYEIYDQTSNYFLNELAKDENK